VFHYLNFYILNFISRVAQPIFLGKLILYFNKKYEMSKDEAYGYAGALIVATLISIALNHHSFLICQKIGMRIRIACCSIIYRKVSF
jgi:ABC transporter transmembrane region.